LRLSLLLEICALLVPALASAQPSVSASALENQFWNTFERNDLPALKAMMTPDYLSVEDGVSTREQVVANLSHCKLNGFTLSDQRDQTISVSAMATVYHIHEEATCGDKHYSGTYIATTVWVRQKGKWLAQLHTEHPLDEKKQ